MANDAVMTCPEPVALPIIFVPGIMGSRLRIRTTGQRVWNPDSTRAAIAMAWDDAVAKRQNLVGPDGRGFQENFLEVDPGEVGGTLSQERIDRNWGGLLQGFYLSFMAWLEHTAETPATKQVPRGCFNLHYEVWAHPYNWTDDNTESGKKLVETVDAAISATKNKYADTDIRVLKPVIITHSMGGLVSRAYTQLHGGKDKVHGVIHGAMPTDGAPALYKRLMAGFEGSGLMGTIERHALGANQREVTATAGNCPGPLGLLPNRRHKSVDGSKDWLKCVGRTGAQIWSKPSINPYDEIYTNRTDWWRMIYNEYLDGCVFRGDPPTCSDLTRPPIPILSARGFRAMRPPL